MHHLYIFTTQPKLKNKLRKYAIFLVLLVSIFVGYQQIIKLRGSKAVGVNPTISSISPTTGPNSGGTYVTISGSNFATDLYSRSIMVNNTSSSALTDYQLAINFDTASLIAAGKMRSDCGDIRIKDTDETSDLNYWLDGGCNTPTTVIWVKIPSISASSTKNIYVTYGNTSLVTASNITNFSFGALLAGSNNKMWLKAHDGTSATTNGSAISSWTDKSGTGNNAAQATSSKQPTFQTNVLNGLPAVTFSAATGQTLTNSTNFTTPYSMIYVSKQTGGANSRVVSGLNNNWLLGYWGGNKDQFHPTGWVNNPSTPSDTSWHLYTGMGTGSLSTLFHNGTELASNTGGLAGPNGVSLNGYLGSSEFSNAQITEFLIFNTALSSTDRQLIEDYLNSKYRLYNTSSIPTITILDEKRVVTVTIGSNSIVGNFQDMNTVTTYTPAGTGLQNIILANSDGSLSNSYSGFNYGGTSVPNPIINLSTTGSDSGQVSLGWTAPNDNGSSITDYEIKYSLNSDMSSSITYNDGISTNTTATVNGLTNGMTYYFQVYPVNNQGTGLGSNILSSVADCDTNLAGADFTPSNGATLTGRYCNIGTFTVGSGVTISLSQANVIKIYANTVNINGTLSGVGKGYAGTTSGGTGPGGLSSAQYGGSYGGVGGSGGSTGATYGSIPNPTDLGSSGGQCTNGASPGGNGGGGVKLTVSGTSTINGSITVNGQNGILNGVVGCDSGGGSGGSIWIDTDVLAGNGTLSGNGGNSPMTYGGASGGGGGRIALHYTTKTFKGAATVSGGAYNNNSRWGGPGTIYEKNKTDSYGSLSVNNNSINVGQNATPVVGISNYKNLTISNAVVDHSSTVINSLETLTLNNLGTLILGTTTSQNITTANINSGGILTHKANTSTKTDYLDLILTTLTVNLGGTINVNAKGYVGTTSGGTGPGGLSSAQYGGSYGGVGGSGGSTGATYGSIPNPSDLGSSGGQCVNGASPGGNGGGGVKLTVSGTSTINGSITVNGQNGIANLSVGCDSGGGSGGSIWIDTDVLAGNGILSGNGGNSPMYYGRGAGGGGGRIALHYNAKTFNGTATVSGGIYNDNSRWGGPGSIYEKNKADSYGSLSVNNNSINVGQNATPVVGISNYKNLTISNAVVDHSSTAINSLETLTVNNLGTLSLGTTNSQSIDTIIINSGGVLTHASNSGSISHKLVINSSSITINNGGLLDAVGKGYSGVASGNGNGAGGGLVSSRSGGSYGGVGSSSAGGPFSTTYGSVNQPVDLGSAGGACSQRGGNGGGAIKLVVSGTLTVNGTITTRGEDSLNIGSGCNSGGGSAGSIWLDAGTFAGSGILGADGGNTTNYNSGSGAGGGGRIAMYYTTKTFNGTVTAKGGIYDNVSLYGGPGTIYEKSSNQINGNVKIDNGLYVQQVATPLDSLISYNDVTIGIGKVDASALTATGTLTLNNLGTLSLGTTNSQSINIIIINSGGVLTHKVNTTTKVDTLTISADSITINSGGKIDVSAQGFSNGNGPGAGIGNNGASYGGVGGSGGAVAPTYGSATKPIDLGSGGGACGASKGGNGGGAIKFIIKNTFTVNGSLLSNGQDGQNTGSGCNGGGGSGGSIWIDTNILNGVGIIAANGGSTTAYNSGSGAGGGGRIALYYGVKNYTGTTAVAGGTYSDPSRAGSLGTIYEVTSIFSTDMVDGSGQIISNPSIAMSPTSPQFDCNTITGILGTSSQKLHIINTTSNPLWSVGIAPTGGNTATWTTGSQTYDFNDATSLGCSDGSDTDSISGQLTINPVSAAILAEGGCSSTGLSKGALASYSEGINSSVNLLNTSSLADTGCYWDITNIGLSQTIPAQQSAGNYSLPMTITIVAN